MWKRGSQSPIYIWFVHTRGHQVHGFGSIVGVDYYAPPVIAIGVLFSTAMNTGNGERVKAVALPGRNDSFDDGTAALAVHSPMRTHMKPLPRINYRTRFHGSSYVFDRPLFLWRGERDDVLAIVS